MTPEKKPKRDHMMGDRAYKLVDALAVLILPGLGTAYFALAQIWGLPAAAKVVGTITVIDTFLGVLLKAAQNSYDKSDSNYDGQMVISEMNDKKVYQLDLEGDPEDMDSKKKVTFRVKTPAK